MTANAKTRNKSNAKAYRARKAAARREMFADEYAHETYVEPPTAPTSKLYRVNRIEMAQHLLSPNGGGHLALRDKDAAGPLREGVGLTAQRGGELDYIAPPTDDRRPTGWAHIAKRRAAQIDNYTRK